VAFCSFQTLHLFTYSGSNLSQLEKIQATFERASAYIYLRVSHQRLKPSAFFFLLRYTPLQGRFPRFRNGGFDRRHRSGRLLSRRTRDSGQVGSSHLSSSRLKKRKEKRSRNGNWLLPCKKRYTSLQLLFLLLLIVASWREVIHFFVPIFLWHHSFFWCLFRFEWFYWLQNDWVYSFAGTVWVLAITERSSGLPLGGGPSFSAEKENKKFLGMILVFWRSSYEENLSFWV
jgi:hypothetical protein